MVKLVCALLPLRRVFIRDTMSYARGLSCCTHRGNRSELRRGPCPLPRVLRRRARPRTRSDACFRSAFECLRGFLGWALCPLYHRHLVVWRESVAHYQQRPLVRRRLLKANLPRRIAPRPRFVYPRSTPTCNPFPFTHTPLSPKSRQHIRFRGSCLRRHLVPWY